ncbi:Rpn family recombination-promoting nuclease/putative transposase [Polyangium mundeleinium]|uniref:Rpn family recombination-promoting nuclease/putative transposase n=1 Tax=Polyangium mundeleinium TaxID=2995306 RepID=A0ABT5EKM4_9BACT|nr:Rpn family recombination-promoting nuclease/putative transposase [Polyangium mundeleinium]MDC0741492.1 Rpn family recombination-promoting nuclease/putative transposase [Polyangium mundeleinium]
MPKPRRPDPLSQPHDALFKWAFSQREHAVGLLRAALPRELADVIDWGTLRLEQGSFVDRALRHRHGDLVFSARIRGKTVYFHALVEQQRDVDPLMVFRMGVYMFRLWEQLVRDEPALKELPPIIPIVVHHSEAGWTAATAFQDLVPMDATVRPRLSPFVPQFELRLIDLGGGRAGDLVERALTALGQVVLWCLSVAGDDARFEREIERIGQALDEVLLAKDGLAALGVLLRYLAATHQRIGAEKVGEILESATGSEVRDVIITWLDKVEERGRVEGRMEGRVEGRMEGQARLLRKLLTARFGALPASARTKIADADEATLSRWGVRLLTAETLDEVFGEVRRAAPPSRPSSSSPRVAKTRARVRRSPA